MLWEVSITMKANLADDSSKELSDEQEYYYRISEQILEFANSHSNLGNGLFSC